jgi:RimJ/RimL family protein N-acetyltransferase
MIREATVQDLPHLVCMGEEFYRYHDISKYIPFDPESLEKMISICLENPDAALFVCEEEGKIAGCIWGIVFPSHLNCNYKIATELTWYVHKEYRGKNYALDLVDTFENWAQEKGATVVILISLEKNNKIENVYERLNYIKCESSFVKGVY